MRPMPFQKAGLLNMPSMLQELFGKNLVDQNGGGQMNFGDIIVITAIVFTAVATLVLACVAYKQYNLQNHITEIEKKREADREKELKQAYVVASIAKPSDLRWFDRNKVIEGCDRYIFLVENIGVSDAEVNIMIDGVPFFEHRIVAEGHHSRAVNLHNSSPSYLKKIPPGEKEIYYLCIDSTISRSFRVDIFWKDKSGLVGSRENTIVSVPDRVSLDADVRYS